MKSKVTLSIDSVIIESAKAKGINISAAAEQGISAFLGQSQRHKVQRGEKGEFIMTEEVSTELEAAYLQFEKYISSAGSLYDHSKATIWIYERAVHVGMDAEELLQIFEDRYGQYLAKRAEEKQIVVSEEATNKLLDIYSNSFTVFVDHLYRNYIAQQDITGAEIRSKIESSSYDWVDVRKKRLMGISRKDLYTILKTKYNEKKGKQIL